MKICTKCHIAKSLNLFPKMTSSKDGFHVRCKQCMNAASAAWKKANSDKVKMDNKLDHAKRGESRKAQMRSHYRTNKSVCRERTAKWQRKNRDAMNAINAKRKATKLQATPNWSNKDKIAEFYFAADFLGMVTGIWHHVDHIVPLQSDIVCGLHWEENLQVLTGVENMSKGNRFWPDMPEGKCF